MRFEVLTGRILHRCPIRTILAFTLSLFAAIALALTASRSMAPDPDAVARCEGYQRLILLTRSTDAVGSFDMQACPRAMQ